MIKLLLTAILATGIASHAFADTGFITKESKYPFLETVTRVEAAIKEAGATLWVRIDLKAAATKGEALRPHQVFIFGRGGALEPLLSANSFSGIDLPQKILVFEDPAGKVWVVYNSGDYVAQRHNIKGKDDVGVGINKVVGGITDKVAKQ